MEKIKSLEVGAMAPPICLSDQDNNPFCLKDLRGKWVVVYFYPKDDTPGCTIEAIDFTKQLEKFQKLNAMVVGISPDSTKSHCKFRDKHSLEVTLLSDPEHKVLEAYDVWQQKKMYGKEYFGVVRSTFLIDPEGKIKLIWSNVKADGHVDQVLSKLKELT